MSKIGKKSAKKQASLVLTGTLVASSVIPSMGNAIDFQTHEVEQRSERMINEGGIASRTTMEALAADFKEQNILADNDTFEGTRQLQIPGPRDVYSFVFGKDEALKEFNESHKIQEVYIADNGLLAIGKGDGKNAPYWHDSTHGIAINDGNYMEVPVAGNATVSFSLCQYGKGGTLSVENMQGEGEFDVNTLKLEGQKACDETITYTYTGAAGILRFKVKNGGEAYLHGITVKNMGELKGSPVANEQAAMPKEMDQTKSLDVTPVGHRLVFEHANNASDISNLQSGIGYYVFDARAEVAAIEADIQISAIGSGSGQGVFVGLFDDKDEIKNIATVGIRGDGKIRNVYNKSGQAKPSAGSIDQTYNAKNTIHVKLYKNAQGWYSQVASGDKASDATIKFSNTELLNDINEKVRYGFAFSNVNGIITNLTFKDEKGNILYDQTDCYEAIGTPPQAAEVEKPVISKDRKNITVSWSGESCSDDEAYRVEISKDGGQTFETAAAKITDKSYTADIDRDGDYVFRITGVCGKKESAPQQSPGISVVAPLESPVIAGENLGEAVKLSWEAVDEATVYEIYRKSPTQNTYTLLADTKELEFSDLNVEQEEPYYYYVVATSKSNTSNPSNEILMVASAGREGKYVYEKEAAEIFITKKSYDTVYKNEAVLEGVTDKKGIMKLEVNGQFQDTAEFDENEKFGFTAMLEEGRNDVNLLFTDEAGKVTRQTFNFVYLTNYDIVVDGSFAGNDGDSAGDNLGARMYKTVQAAVDSVPTDNAKRVVILVKEGSYREYLRIASPYITLVGEDREKVNINYFDVKDTPVGGDTSKRCAIYVQSGAKGFAAENLTFENTYEYLGDGTISNESADALRVDADEATFVNVKLKGYQDTLQANTGHQYFYKCYILGNVDYIYGTNGRTLFNDCDLVYRYSSKKNSGYITAPKTDAKYSYGYIFNDSRVYAEEGCSGSKYLLARPWGADASATFINTYMSGIVNKTESYSDMSGNLYKNARFREFYSYGDGYAINSSRPQISKAQAEEMLSIEFLGWDPYSAVQQISRNDFVGEIVTESEDKFIEAEYAGSNGGSDAESGNGSNSGSGEEGNAGESNGGSDAESGNGSSSGNGEEGNAGGSNGENDAGSGNGSNAGSGEEGNAGGSNGGNDAEGGNGSNGGSSEGSNAGESNGGSDAEGGNGSNSGSGEEGNAGESNGESNAEGGNGSNSGSGEEGNAGGSNGDSDTGNSSGSNGGRGSSHRVKVEIVKKPADMEEAKPAADVSVQFQDTRNHWAEASIEYVAKKGLLKGMGEKTFAPDKTMTRAMFATVLYRLAGEAEIAGANTFKDVKPGSWYEKAVIWTSEKGIVKGIGKNAFGPNSEITREQIAVMLYSYIKTQEIEIQKQAETVDFNDKAKIAPWAQEALMFMSQTGIMQGDGRQNCNPKAKATRAEVSAMLQRCMEIIQAQ